MLRNFKFYRRLRGGRWYLIKIGYSWGDAQTRWVHNYSPIQFKEPTRVVTWEDYTDEA